MKDEHQAGEMTPAQRAQRHRRLAKIFGDGPPGQTRDDLPGPDEHNSNDAWLRRQVPPHHVG